MPPHLTAMPSVVSSGFAVANAVSIAVGDNAKIGANTVVFSILNDPVGQGFVATLARPGGNLTGFTFIDFPLIGKWVELLKELAPSVKRMTLIFNPVSTPFYPRFLGEFGAASASRNASWNKPKK